MPIALLWFGFFSFGILRVMNWSNLSFMWKGVNSMKDSNLLISSIWDKKNQQQQLVDCGSPDLLLNRIAFHEKEKRIESSYAQLGRKLLTRAHLQKASIVRFSNVNRRSMSEVESIYQSMQHDSQDLGSSLVVLVDTEFQGMNDHSTDLFEICAMTWNEGDVFQRESVLLIDSSFIKFRCISDIIFSSDLIKHPKNFVIDPEVQGLTNLTSSQLHAEGVELRTVMEGFVQFLQRISEENGNKSIVLITYGMIDFEVINDALLACDMSPLHEHFTFEIHLLNVIEVVKCHDIYKSADFTMPKSHFHGGSGFSLESMCKVADVEYSTEAHRARYDCLCMEQLIAKFPDFAIYGSMLMVSIRQLHYSVGLSNIGNHEELTLLKPLFRVLGIDSNKRGLPHQLREKIASEQHLYSQIIENDIDDTSTVEYGEASVSHSSIVDSTRMDNDIIRENVALSNENSKLKGLIHRLIQLKKGEYSKRAIDDSLLLSVEIPRGSPLFVIGETREGNCYVKDVVDGCPLEPRDVIVKLNDMTLHAVGGKEMWMILFQGLIDRGQTIIVQIDRSHKRTRIRT